MQQLKDRGENIPPEDIKEVAKEIKVRGWGKCKTKRFI